MTWGCTITNARVEWGTAFSLTVNLELLLNTTGNKVPVMGRSGGGKSTLLNLMAGLKWPVQGRVSWCFPGVPAVAWGSNGLPLSAQQVIGLRRRHFGFVFQDSTLIPHLRVWENLAYPLELQGMSTYAARFKAHQRLGDVLVEGEDVDVLLKRFPQQLSSGQRQRVALMQALIHDPFVLFADEPTGNLDGQTRKEVMNVLKRWLKDHNERLLIWVTHYDDDPAQLGVKRRLYVAGGTCHWQTCNAGCWQDDRH